MTHVILVVEDNERNLKLLRDVLEYAGYDVRVARTAEDGITSAVSEPPDLVLMDLQLPGIDGMEALRRLRAKPADSGHTRGRGNGPGDEAGPGTGLGCRLRRIHREADQRPCVSRSGSQLPLSWGRWELSDTGPACTRRG